MCRALRTSQNICWLLTQPLYKYCVRLRSLRHGSFTSFRMTRK